MRIKGCTAHNVNTPAKKAILCKDTLQRTQMNDPFNATTVMLDLKLNISWRLIQGCTLVKDQCLNANIVIKHLHQLIIEISMWLFMNKITNLNANFVIKNSSKVVTLDCI